MKLGQGFIMKATRLLTAIGIMVSSSAVAEPYAEWGVFADGTPISETDTSMKMPATSDIPIPLAPGGVLVVNGGGGFNCTIQIISKQSVGEVCAFYRSKLNLPEYQIVEDLESRVQPSCAIYHNGNVEKGSGIWVNENKDPLFTINGSTSIYVSYQPPAGKLCNE
jgi:hypothetical protein